MKKLFEIFLNSLKRKRKFATGGVIEPRNDYWMNVHLFKDKPRVDWVKINKQLGGKG